MLQAVGGPGQGYTWTLLLSSLDTDCLLLSNQAKLEAKLESNHAATVSKLDPGVALSYHTPTQECLVAKDGVDTCTDFYQIPAGFSQGKTVTGTLKVGAAVTSISDYAFAYTDLTELHLSEATALLTIGDAAFYGNAQLTGTLKVGPGPPSFGSAATPLPAPVTRGSISPRPPRSRPSAATPSTAPPLRAKLSSKRMGHPSP